MTRPVIFRGITKRTREWVRGSLVIDPDGTHTIHYSDVVGKRTAQVFPETVGQFIDVLDTTGHEIHEGDRVKIGDYPSIEVVSFTRNAWRIGGVFMPHELPKLLVVGNIHQR